MRERETQRDRETQRERERERETQGERETERERQRDCLGVFIFHSGFSYIVHPKNLQN